MLEVFVTLKFKSHLKLMWTLKDFAKNQKCICIISIFKIEKILNFLHLKIMFKKVKMVSRLWTCSNVSKRGYLSFAIAKCFQAVQFPIEQGNDSPLIQMTGAGLSFGCYTIPSHPVGVHTPSPITPEFPVSPLSTQTGWAQAFGFVPPRRLL